MKWIAGRKTSEISKGFTNIMRKSLVHFMGDKFKIAKINPPTYDLIFMDITNNCNLRCPYCTNDWTKPVHSKLMNMETFKRVLDLFPLVHPEGLLFSCSFEPTIHPNLIDLLQAIPPEEGHKVYFTTNLSKDLPDKIFHAWANLSLHHINISLDSFIPEVFEDLRRPAKFERFMNNLERLVDIFKKYHGHPALQYITVVVRTNIKEVPNILKRCATLYMGRSNQFRYCFPWFYNVTQEWKERYLPDYNEWSLMEISLKKMTYPYTILNAPPPPSLQQKAVSMDNIVSAKPPSYPSLNIVADGTVFIRGGVLYQEGKNNRFNINDIDNPYEFFLKILKDELDCRAAIDQKK